MPRVYIIILNYKKWKDVIECLETLFRSQYEHYTVIVIDNDSQNDSLEHLLYWAEHDTDFNDRITDFSKEKIQKPIGYQYFNNEIIPADIKPVDLPQLVFVQNKKNKGFAGGMNGVLEYLEQEDAFIWLLNPDMTVEENTLPQLVAFAARQPRRSIIGSVIKYYSDPNKVHLYAGGKINFNSGTIGLITKKSAVPQMDYVSGGSLFTHASTFIELGLLPEEYFLYWEETDHCYRAKQQGYALCLCETAVCYDKVSSSIGKSFLADYYYTRNGLLFLSKYKKGKVWIAVFFSSLRFLKRIFTGQLARAKGVYEGMLSFLKNDKYAIK